MLLLLVSGLMVAGCRSTRVVEPPQLSRRIPSSTQDRLVVPPGPPSRLTKPDNPWEPPVAARAWRYIVLHHTAGEEGSVASIDAAHRKRVDSEGNHWLGIGYHFLIGNGNGMGDGEIEPTFRWQQQLQGAHAGNYDYNQFGIGIALVGNFEHETPTPAQQAAAARLVATLRRAYEIPADHVVAHRDIRATACPGQLFPFDAIAHGADGEFNPGYPVAVFSPREPAAGLSPGRWGSNKPSPSGYSSSTRSP